MQVVFIKMISGYLTQKWHVRFFSIRQINRGATWLKRTNRTFRKTQLVRWDLTVFAVSSGESGVADTLVAVLFVQCQTRSIVLTRPAATW